VKQLHYGFDETPREVREAEQQEIARLRAQTQLRTNVADLFDRIFATTPAPQFPGE
jgi:hypothetical protein